MSLGNITDVAVQQELRRLLAELDLLKRQVAQSVRDVGVITRHSNLNELSFAKSGHTGFASSAQLTAHTGDSTIHFTVASLLALIPLVQAATPATDGTDGYLWINTTADPHKYAVLLNNSAGTPEWHQVLKGRTP